MPQEEDHQSIDDFLANKSEYSKGMFNHLIEAFKLSGNVTVIPAKTMIGIATPRKRIAYVTNIGKNFIHVVFPFTKSYTDNLCFQKIAQVPGDSKQYNHHFRMQTKEDLNEEVFKFIKLAIQLGS